MQTKIRLLDEHTINKIAAGEVIENPSSVVKELVENSIDAGASEICVEIQEGGRQLIRISDNGCGMDQDDALLCLERHATSKLKEVEDMESLSTMGFRGEAIPSIASISKFMLLTSTQNEGVKGTLILIEGGKVLHCNPAARSKGTTIEVKSLFFNVPVRRKFQKSPSFDTNEILKILTIQALAHPTVHFELISNQKSILRTPISSPKEALFERIQEILGGDFATEVSFLEGQKEGCQVSGYIGLPIASRPNRSMQFLFINQRPVSCPLVTHTIREAYGTALSTSRHPIFVLHLNLPGSFIDVNVHPQKKEVRIRQEPLIKALLNEAIQRALRPQEINRTYSFAESTSSFAPLTEPNFDLPADPISFPFGGDFFDHSIYQEINAPQIPLETSPLPIEPSLPLEPIQPKKPKAKVLATLKGFFLSEDEAGLWLVDQRAAHFRILFEQLLQQKESLHIQTLLVPYTLELTALESAVMRGYLPKLQIIGIQIQEFGPNTFIIDGLPPLLEEGNLEPMLQDLVRDFGESQLSHSLKQEKEKHFAHLALRMSISTERRLSISEAETLLNQLINCPTPQFCPHGKPTMVALHTENIQNFFKLK